MDPDRTDLPCPTSSRFEERKVVRLGMNGLDALSTANAGFERRLRLVRRDDWELGVRALVNLWWARTDGTRCS